MHTNFAAGEICTRAGTSTISLNFIDSTVCFLLLYLQVVSLYDESEHFESIDRDKRRVSTCDASGILIVPKITSARYSTLLEVPRPLEWMIHREYLRAKIAWNPLEIEVTFFIIVHLNYLTHRVVWPGPYYSLWYILLFRSEESMDFVWFTIPKVPFCFSPVEWSWTDFLGDLGNQIIRVSTNCMTDELLG